MDYSQTDPRWSSKLVGFGVASFKDVGCTVTSFTNFYNRVFKCDVQPDWVNEELKRVNAFKGGLIYWPNIHLAFPHVKFIQRVYNYNNITVAWYVYVKRLPVLVEVNNHGTKHWVLYIGNQKLVDPLDGLTKPTSTYPATGFSLLQAV